MTEHNKDMFKIIQVVRKRMKELGPYCIEGREQYNLLLMLYAQLDVESEIKDESN